MIDYPLSYLLRFLLDAAAFLTIACVGVTRLREGRWAVLASFGGGLASLAAMVQLEAYVEAKFFSTSHLLDLVFLQHAHADDLLGWGRVIGFVLVAAALVELVRSRAPHLPRPAQR